MRKSLNTYRPTKWQIGDAEQFTCRSALPELACLLTCRRLPTLLEDSSARRQSIGQAQRQSSTTIHDVCSASACFLA